MQHTSRGRVPKCEPFSGGKASDVAHFSPVPTMQHQDKKPKLINYYRGCY